MNWLLNSARTLGLTGRHWHAPADHDDCITASASDFMEEPGDDLFDWDHIAFRRPPDDGGLIEESSPISSPEFPEEDHAAMVEGPLAANDIDAEAIEPLPVQDLLPLPETPGENRYRTGRCCPSCGGRSWFIRSMLAECANCGSALPLAHGVRGASAPNHRSRPGAFR